MVFGNPHSYVGYSLRREALSPESRCASEVRVPLQRVQGFFLLLGERDHAQEGRYHICGDSAVNLGRDHPGLHSDAVALLLWDLDCQAQPLPQENPQLLGSVLSVLGSGLSVRGSVLPDLHLL